MNKKLAALFSSIALLLLPVVSLAINFPPQPVGQALDIRVAVSNIINFIWPIVVGIVVIMFLAAGIIFLTAQGEPNKISQARQAVIWGVAGVIVIVLAFSIQWIVQATI